MKLAKDKFDAAVLAFAMNELFPAMGNSWKTWLMAGGLPLMMPQAHDMLTRLGMEDKDGVHMEALEAFMANAFKAQQTVEVPVLGMTFEKGDGDKLIAMLKGQPQQQQTHKQPPLF